MTAVEVSLFDSLAPEGPVIDRRALLALCRTTWTFRLSGSCSVIDPAWVSEAVPADGEIVFVGAITGGDESWTVARWSIPLQEGGRCTRSLLVRSTRLHEIVLGVEA